MPLPHNEASEAGSEQSVASSLKRVCADQQTGVFTVRQGGIRRAVMLNSGRPVFASSTDREDRLNGVLMRQGAVTLAHLVHSMGRMLRENRRLGDILVDEGLLEPPVLMGALRSQIREIICTALNAGADRCTFRRQHVPEASDVGFTTPVNALIREALFRTSGFHLILDQIGPPGTAYGLTERADEEVRTTGLTPPQVDLLPLFEHHATIQQICDASALSDLDICRLIWVLQTVGAIQRVE